MGFQQSKVDEFSKFNEMRKNREISMDKLAFLYNTEQEIFFKPSLQDFEF